MKKKIEDLWKAIAAQDQEEMRKFFLDDAKIMWNNTNELFSLENYIRANYEYPGRWSVQMERIDQLNDEEWVSTALVSEEGEEISYYTVSYYLFKDNKIVYLSEYWSENTETPQWRIEMKINELLK